MIISLLPTHWRKVGLFLAATVMVARAEETPGVAVNARVFNGYTRTKLADGSFKPEHYAFGEGGRWIRGAADNSVAALPFRKIAETIAEPLRSHGYLPATDPTETDLMILVFWGVTSGAENGEYSNSMPAVSGAMTRLGTGDVTADEDFTSALMMMHAENQIRDQSNQANARILGYREDYERALELEETGHRPSHDTVPELEANRYFVVLKAYDFRTAAKQKKLKLMWEARFSIYERGNKFDDQLLAMTRTAARYFGQDTKGLVRQDLPEGKVEIGTPTVIELGEDAKPNAKP